MAAHSGINICSLLFKLLDQIVVLNEKITEVVNSNPVKELIPSCFLLDVNHFSSGEGLAASVGKEKVLDLERIVRITF